MADPEPTLSDAIYLAECHADTGCLERACDYGHQVRSGQLSGKQWDLGRLRLGAAYVVASLLKRKEGQK